MKAHLYDYANSIEIRAPVLLFVDIRHNKVTSANEKNTNKGLDI